ATRTCWWISPVRNAGSRSCGRAASLVLWPMARSSGGPPARAADWSCTSSTGRMRHFSFPHHRGRHRGGDEGDALILFIPQSPLYRTKTRKSVTCVTVPEGRGGVGEVG